MNDATSRAGTKRATSSQDAGRSSVPRTSIQRVEADGVQVFYRTAGVANASVVLLLHGFPTSSFMFRELIPRLANDYRVVAPDLPAVSVWCKRFSVNFGAAALRPAQTSQNQ